MEDPEKLGLSHCWRKEVHVLKTTSLSIGACLMFWIFAPVTHAQTIQAASCNASDVQSALNSVSSATATVVIPPGNCKWTNQVSYSVPPSVTNLTIQGHTTVDCTGTAGTSSYACTATDNTVLVDSYDSNNPFWSITTGPASSYFRITGITFEGGSSSRGKSDGFIDIGGSTRHLRVDHCNFNGMTYTPLSFSNGGVTIYYTPITGVFDHNTFEMFSEGNAIRVYGSNDAPWSQPTQFGSSNFLFAENNYFTDGAANDCNYGGRMVIRYNTITGVSNGDNVLWQGHAPGQGDQNSRGCRALEIYHNYILSTGNTQYSAGGASVGTGLVWGNTVSGYQYDAVLEEIREIATGHDQTDAPNGIGYCGTASDGVASPYDGNSGLESGGWPCFDQTGRGEGDSMSGSFPNFVDDVTGTQSWHWFFPILPDRNPVGKTWRWTIPAPAPAAITKVEAARGNRSGLPATAQQPIKAHAPYVVELRFEGWKQEGSPTSKARRYDVHQHSFPVSLQASEK